MLDPLPFSINSHEVNERWGTRCFQVVLPDGREAFVNCDSYTIEQGVLMLWAPAKEPVMSIAPGGWVSIYAASVLDGTPVILDHVSAPERRK